MPFDTPFMLGPFAVDAEGRLAPRDPEAMPAFLVRWRGRVVRARLRQAGPHRGRLVLSSVLGRVPSTGTAADAVPRANSFVAIRWVTRQVPDAWQLGLLPDHRLLLQAEAETALPITASALLTELTGFLLRLAPYLELLEEVGLARPGAGTVNTWPG